MRPRSVITVSALVFAGVAMLCILTRPDRVFFPRTSLSVAAALRTANDQGYTKVLAPREFQFPADHGPHPKFRTEWWYYTGNLETAAGRRFGFQLTFFRSALAPEMPARESAWATRQAWLAHFTVSDVADGTFHSFERWSRGALGLAGSRVQPFGVRVKDWTAASMDERTFPMRLLASADNMGDKLAIDLVLRQGKPPVLQGERGLSRKSAEPGNASYYYSLTRMPAAGHVTVKGERFAVTGLAWMDREWSTSSLGREQVGWDWFSLQLSDGWDVMLYQLRRKNGTADPASSGTLIDPRGDCHALGLSDFQIVDSGKWQSPRSGARYPARWRLRIPGEDLDLEVRPLLADQELDVSFRYWEGAVEIEGTHHGRPVRGRGYVELTGYSDEAQR